MGLSDALLALEQAAAAVALALDDADDDLIAQVIAGWGLGGNRGKAWIQWIRDCGDAWPAVELPELPDPAHEALIRWATGTPPARRHKTGHGAIGRWPQKSAKSGDGLSV